MGMSEHPEGGEIAVTKANREEQRWIYELEMVQELLESAYEGVLVEITPDGTIHSINARTEEMFGYSREELLGAQVELLIPERLRQQHIAHREDYLRAPRSRPMGIGMDLKGIR